MFAIVSTPKRNDQYGLNVNNNKNMATHPGRVEQNREQQ